LGNFGDSAMKIPREELVHWKELPVGDSVAYDTVVVHKDRQAGK
jgi:hypothetical protein